jgi:hypothetical protein
MVKKPGNVPRRVVPDWSWVNTEAKSAEEITPEHRAGTNMATRRLGSK